MIPSPDSPGDDLNILIGVYPGLTETEQHDAVAPVSHKSLSWKTGTTVHNRRSMWLPFVPAIENTQHVTDACVNPIAKP